MSSFRVLTYRFTARVFAVLDPASLAVGLPLPARTVVGPFASFRTDDPVAIPGHWARDDATQALDGAR